MRIARVNNLLKQSISEILLREVNDPRLTKVVLTDVSTSADLGHARVYYSLLGTVEEQEAAHIALEKAAPFIRRHAGGSLHLRSTPRLRFFRDKSLAGAQRIEEIIREHKENSEPEEEKNG